MGDQANFIKKREEPLNAPEIYTRTPNKNRSKKFF